MRQQMRVKCRPILRYLKFLKILNRATLVYVKAHQNGGDFDSKMNTFIRMKMNFFKLNS